jgi:hypothetical protein
MSRCNLYSTSSSLEVVSLTGAVAFSFVSGSIHGTSTSTNGIIKHFPDTNNVQNWIILKNSIVKSYTSGNPAIIIKIDSKTYSDYYCELSDVIFYSDTTTNYGVIVDVGLSSSGSYGMSIGTDCVTNYKDPSATGTAVIFNLTRQPFVTNLATLKDPTY